MSNPNFSESDTEELENSSEEMNVKSEDMDVKKANPVGQVLRVSGEGKFQANYYGSFEYDGETYKLDIIQKPDGAFMVVGPWLISSDEKRRSEILESCDIGELIYIFHETEMAAESVVQNCFLHFIPLHKQIPKFFIVQKIYDIENERLRSLIADVSEGTVQNEIDLLIQKTVSRLSDLPNIKAWATLLKLNHRKNPALFASGEGNDVIPPLAAIYGKNLADSYEALGIDPDPDLMFCEKCKTVLLPGKNCNVQIEENKAMIKRKRNKKKIPPQSNVVYACDFCSFRNLLSGNPKGYMKEIYHSREDSLGENKEHKNKKYKDPQPQSKCQNEKEANLEPEAQPIGDMIEISGNGMRNHYASFQYNGCKYDLDDIVLLIPKYAENKNQKPRVAIVKELYDWEQKKLLNLTDKDYEDSKKHEIDLLVQKTISLLGDLPDLESEDTAVDQEDPTAKKNMSPK